MKQRSLFDDDGIKSARLELHDPFTKAMPKNVKSKPKKEITLHVGKPATSPSGKQIVYGTVPSKSNCYRIITFKPKRDAPHKIVTCPTCDGKCMIPQRFGDDIECPECKGSGEVSKAPHAHASLAKTKELQQYEQSFFMQPNMYKNKMIDGEFEFEIDVYYPNRRSDLDNSLKVTLDCLQKMGAFKNDNKCVQILAKKFVDPENPRIEFSIKQSCKPH